METSDSECFESADEDFFSDDETNTVKETQDVGKHNEELSREIQNSNVVKSIDVNKNANIESTQVETLSECLNKTIIKDELNNVKTTTNDSQVCVLPEKFSSTTNIIKDTKVKSELQEKKEVVQTKTEEPTGETSESKVESLKDSNIKLDNKLEKPSEEPEVKPCTNVNSKQLELEHKLEPLDKSKITKNNEPVDDTLWDDDELDWGKEEALDKESEWKKPNQLEEPADNMWENDDWEPIENVNDAQSTNQIESDNSWGGWSGWGVSSILNTATQSVSTITSQVSQGITTVIGLPDPEELARINKKEQEKMKNVLENEDHNEKGEPSTPLGFGLGNLGTLVSGVTKLVESTGTKVISGGLDTLETIGKKTMEVLQEGDPGLKKKRAFLKLEKDKPILSQILREAKERAESEQNKKIEENYSSYKKNYETLFDDHQGLVHLEALEMLSKQCDIKLQTISESLTGDKLTDFQETMDQVKELCEIPSDEEDEQVSFDEINDKLTTLVSEIKIPISYERLLSCWKETDVWLNNIKLNICDENELHQQAIETLAQLTAIAVEQFHKGGELLLVKEHRSTADEADCLVQLTTTLTCLIGLVASKFSDKLNEKASQLQNKDHINTLITNVFYESANSSTYIQNAFQLLLPVLQVGAI